MTVETIGFLSCDSATGDARLQAFADAGLALRRVRDGDRLGAFDAVVLHAPDADAAGETLARLTDQAAGTTPVLVLLDRGASGDRARLLGAGAEDCLSGEVTAEELGARLGRLTSRAELARQTARHSAMLAREMTHARRVQEHILPLEPPVIDGVGIAARWVPAADIGGDLFDIIPLGPSEIAFFMADVVGHGIGAALNTMLIKSQLSIWARPGIQVGETLGILNNYLYELTGLDYATAVYAVLDTATRRLSYAVAGHPNPLLVCRDGSVRMLEPPASHHVARGVHVGLPLGLFQDGVYIAGEITLAPGDRVVMYTDGLIEWRTGGGEMLGIEGLRALLEKTRAAALDDQASAVLAALEPAEPGAPPDDDINFLAFELRD